MSNISDNKRIAKNTTFLYLRMLLLIAVQLYTVPIVMKNLGISDYGLYNVVGGLVTMFSFLGSSLSSGTQRFLSFAIGKNDPKLLKTTFSTVFVLFLIIGICSLVVLELIGTWFLNNKMIIPNDRIFSANIVFHFSSLSFFVNIISIPYNSSIIAHEKMGVFAYTSIFECVSKLILAISLSYYLGDKLIFYSLFILIIALLLRFYYQFYCVRKFIECKVSFDKWDKNLGKELISYCGWNVIGVFANIGRTNGLNVIINLFFGTLVNAAHGISVHISGVLTQFANNIYLSTRPQIIKKYAKGEIENMWNLLFSSAKISFYLLLIICIPMFVEMESILSLWLGNVPLYTVYISRMFIIALLIETLVNQIVAGFQAANKIMSYQIHSSVILLISIPLSYLFLKYIDKSIYFPYIISILSSLLYSVSIINIAKRELNINVSKYTKRVLLPSIIVSAISFGVTIILSFLLVDTNYKMFVVIVSSIVVSILVIYMIGLDKKEKKYVNRKINDIIVTIKSKNYV